jgi:uncharacterized protein
LLLKSWKNGKIQKTLDLSAISAFHDAITGLLKQYFYTGGMPAAVKKYCETRDFGEVRDVQKIILDSYYADFLLGC